MSYETLTINSQTSERKIGALSSLIPGPFSQRIMEEPVPGPFKMPQLKPYDGTTDPLNHLESYKTFMRI